MELWDIYNRDRQITGDTMERGSVFPEGALHLVVHICIFNSQGEMLIQQRQPFKEDWAGLWDITVGGSAVAGDSSQVAAERELLEEIGYTVDFSNVRPHFTINYDHGFDDFYLLEADVDISTLQLQAEEVKQVRWATKEDIKGLISSGSFLPYYHSIIDMLFDMRKSYGSHARE